MTTAVQFCYNVIVSSGEGKFAINSFFIKFPCCKSFSTDRRFVDETKKEDEKLQLINELAMATVAKVIAIVPFTLSAQMSFQAVNGECEK